MPTKWFHSGRVFLKINTILKTYITWKAHTSFVLVDMGLFQIFLLESCGQQLVTTWQPGPWPVTAALQQRAQDVPQHHIRLQMAFGRRCFSGVMWGCWRPWRWCPLMSYISGDQPLKLLTHHIISPRDTTNCSPGDRAITATPFDQRHSCLPL